MKRVLVIGAKGMLGQDLADLLRSSRESEVVGWDVEEIDIREEAETVSKIAALHPDVIVHAAAHTRVDDCESQAEEAFAVNVEGTKHVVRGATACGAKVVYLGTDYIFDGRKGEPYTEEDPAHPLNVYGRSKLKGEEYVRALAEKGLIVRTQWLYGKAGPNFVDAVLRQAEEKGELRIVDDQVGSPTYAVDLSHALSHLVDRNAHGIFHVANSGECTWYAFGKAILQWSGMVGVRVRPIRTEELKRPAHRPLYSVLSCQKLRREMGMVMRPWQEAVRAYLESARP